MKREYESESEEDTQTSSGGALSRTDLRGMALKGDNALRPLWIMPESKTIILEAFHPLAGPATDFLIAIAEPVSRPLHIHEYRLTTHSLYAAVSVGLHPEDIIETLNRLSKVAIPDAVAAFIRNSTASFGKVKLVLKQNRHFLESSSTEILRELLQDDVISKAKLSPEEEREIEVAQAQAQQNAHSRDLFGIMTSRAPTREGLVIPGVRQAQAPAIQAPGPEQRNTPRDTQPQDEQSGETTDKPSTSNADDLFSAVVGEEAEFQDVDESVHSFGIRESDIEVVKRRCLDLELPLMEEYDFRHDQQNTDLDISLKPSAVIRPYQEKSLGKMFGNGRARSGIIVLPCGAGKTLVGITAASTIRKSCIVLCTSGVSVMQWRSQFLQWSTLNEKQVSVFTADHKTRFNTDAGVVVSTYSMVANRRKRSYDAQKMMDFLSSREWGLIILDEVHVVPAAMFRQVVLNLKAHAKLGLTATLVREDQKINDLNFLIGPKLYEANWMDLAAKGHIATVQCAEVWCPMTPEFYRQYLREKTRKRMLLYAMNPVKFQACQFLMNYHEARGDKIIVFSDNVYALEAYAKKLGKPYIHGGTPQLERMKILQSFQHSPSVNTIFLSKVGDTSIDIPEATCLIQISSHFGSRRQEAQRLGRILRAKRRNDEGFNAYFYSLVSKDTQEMYFSSKRQGFLIDQGYAFKVITSLDGINKIPDLVYSSRKEQIELLQSVMLEAESKADIDREHEGYGASAVSAANTPGALRVKGSMSALAGAETMAYKETNRSANKQISQEQHKLFRKRAQMRKELKRARDAQ